MAGGRKHVVKVEVLFPLIPLILCFSWNKSKKRIGSSNCIQPTQPTRFSSVEMEVSRTCLTSNLGVVTPANVGHWPKLEPVGGKLPLLLVPSSLEITVQSEELDFCPGVRVKKVAVLEATFSYVNQTLRVLLLNVTLATNRHLVSFFFWCFF